LIYLIDASVYIFRAYYSMPPEMVDRDGHPVNALFGFARMLGDLIERARPKYMAVAFDQSLTTSFRNTIYPPYKAHRDSPPATLTQQMDRCRELCRLLGVAAFSSPEYEADDIIGTLLHSMRRMGVRATVITRDKDLAQLIGDGDVYWDFGGREPCGYYDIERRFGVVPERMADFLALMGDSVDNIKGVPGIGAKTAAALMKEFASLDAIYSDLEQVGKMKMRGAAAIGERLREHRETAYLARQLTCICCDMPLNVTAADLQRRLPDLPAINSFFDVQGFGPLLRKQCERLAQLPIGR
jgi:5'-3' exonuclease